ncbi:Uncharacterized protein FKW44_002365, partial [Caligus rogercresseyi]
MTVPNRFIRISPDGRISYSQRLTVKARCVMDLHKFPGLPALPPGNRKLRPRRGEIMYNWTNKPLSMDQKLGLAQYHPHLWESLRHDAHESKRRRRIRTSPSSDARATTCYDIHSPHANRVLLMGDILAHKTEKGGEIPARTSLGGTTVLAIVTMVLAEKASPCRLRNSSRCIHCPLLHRL